MLLICRRTHLPMCNFNNVAIGIPEKWVQDSGVGCRTRDPRVGLCGVTLGCYPEVGRWDETLEWDHRVGPWGKTLESNGNLSLMLYVMYKSINYKDYWDQAALNNGQRISVIFLFLFLIYTSIVSIVFIQTNKYI